MSFADGWAALHLEMPSRVPRTEYSAEGHWELIQAVTGIEVNVNSPDSVKQQARREFTGPRGWNYDFFWSTLIGGQDLGELRTRMGHAEYAAGGVDFDTRISCPFTDPEDVLNFDPAVYGRKDPAQLTRRFEEHYAANCAANPDGVNMTGIYISMISGLLEIFGWDMLLLAAGTDAGRFGQLAHRYAAWIQQYFDALAAADVPVVMVHDDIVWTSGPFIHPDWYREFVFPNYKNYLTPLRESGKKIMFTSDGNYTEFIDDIAAAGVHGFVLEPTTDLAYLTENYGQTHVIIGNVETRTLLLGSRAEIRAEVVRCLQLGKKCPGFFLAVGNHLPANTPVENALYYNEVYRELCRR